jgi:hypothetical protein
MATTHHTGQREQNLTAHIVMLTGHISSIHRRSFKLITEADACKEGPPYHTYYTRHTKYTAIELAAAAVICRLQHTCEAAGAAKSATYPPTTSFTY